MILPAVARAALAVALVAASIVNSTPDAAVSPQALAQARLDALAGEALKANKRYAPALALYQQAFPVLEAASRQGRHSFDRTSMLVDYLQLMDLNHRYADLLAMSRDELARERQRSARDTELEGLLIESEAAALFGLGRRPEAIARYRDAMAFVERTEGPADRSIAWYFIVMAEAQLDLGDRADLEAAKAALSQAAVRLDPPDFKSSATMALVEQWTRWAVATGRTDLALRLARHAVDYGELIQRDPEAQAVAVAELAQVHAARGDFAQAVALHRRALPALQAVLGDDHPLCAREMEHLAGALAGAGEPAEALRLMQRSIELADEVLGPEHPDTVLRRQHLQALRSRFPA